MSWFVRSVASRTLIQGAIIALLGVAVVSVPVNGSRAKALEPGALTISADVKTQFEQELGANAESAFQVYQNFLTNHPQYAAALTAIFVKGREDLAASIGAAATVALMGSWAGDEVIGQQAQRIAQILGEANPTSSVDTFSAMSAAAPNLGKQVLSGLVNGAPSQKTALDAVATAMGTVSGGTSEGAKVVAAAGSRSAGPRTSGAGLFDGSGSTFSSLDVGEGQIQNCLTSPCSI